MCYWCLHDRSISELFLFIFFFIFLVKSEFKTEKLGCTTNVRSAKVKSCLFYYSIIGEDNKYKNCNSCTQFWKKKVPNSTLTIPTRDTTFFYSICCLHIRLFLPNTSFGIESKPRKTVQVNQKFQSSCLHT